MRHTRTPKLLAATAALALVGAACASDEPEVATPPTTEDTTNTPDNNQPTSDQPSGELCDAVPDEGDGSFAGMVDDPAATAASNNPALSTLVAAATEAELVDTLNADGPFTIFAPANSAFDALGDGNIDALLADPAALTDILTYHVVAGERLSSSDLAGLTSVETLNGTVGLSIEDDLLVLNGGQAVVGCADVQTANATVHIIDGVLLPAVEEPGVAGDDAMDEAPMDEAPMDEAPMDEAPMDEDTMDDEAPMDDEAMAEDDAAMDES